VLKSSYKAITIADSIAKLNKTVFTLTNSENATAVRNNAISVWLTTQLEFELDNAYRIINPDYYNKTHIVVDTNKELDAPNGGSSPP
jgi:hypothetical protein